MSWANGTGFFVKVERSGERAFVFREWDQTMGKARPDERQIATGQSGEKPRDNHELS